MNSTHFCRVTLQGDFKLTKGLQNQNAQLWSQTLLHRKVSGMASLISAMLQQCKIVFFNLGNFFLFFTCLLAFRIYENIFFFQIVDKKEQNKGKKIVFIQLTILSFYSFTSFIQFFSLIMKYYVSTESAQNLKVQLSELPAMESQCNCHLGKDRTLPVTQPRFPCLNIILQFTTHKIISTTIHDVQF